MPIVSNKSHHTTCITASMCALIRFVHTVHHTADLKLVIKTVFIFRFHLNLTYNATPLLSHCSMPICTKVNVKSVTFLQYRQTIA